MPEDTPSAGAPNSPEWYSLEQAAEWLQVSTKTIRRYIEAGSLPAVNLGGRAIRIRRQDLEAWLATRRIEPGVSLRQQVRQERRQARQERHQTAEKRPRTRTLADLADVNVGVAQEEPLLLRCNNCGTIWSAKAHANGRLSSRAWCCPKGCNCR